MNSLLLGTDTSTGEKIRIPRDAFSTHFHLIGGTGKGKTTAIHTMLHSLLMDTERQSCFFIIDRLGNFSQELLLWLASEFCPDFVRERLVYIQPATDEYVPTFNPLSFSHTNQRYYRIERTTEIILRAWQSQDIGQMPRLARWTANAFLAAAHLGLTVSDCNHFVMPGSEYHKPLLRMLPDNLRSEWEEITQARGSEAIRTLDSSRNRLKPYFDCDILRRMFGSTKSRLDVARMMREGKIVIVDLAPKNRLSPQSGNTIGALLINEVIAVARSLPRNVVHETFLFLDEFQNFVGPDIEAALPEVRQLGLRLILSHQSLSQLERGDIDLTNMIFQAQSRMIFGVQGEDADTLAQEVASITYDPRKIKDETYSWKQLITGHDLRILRNWNESHGRSDQRSRSNGKSKSKSNSESGIDFMRRNNTLSRGDQESESDSETSGEGSSYAKTHGGSETLVPRHVTFQELSSRTFKTFEEQKAEWGRDIRNLPVGHALLRLVNDSKLRTVKVRRSAPGFLGFDIQRLASDFPQVLEDVDRLIENNFKSEFFASADEIDRESERRIKAVLNRGVQVVETDEADVEEPPADSAGFGI